ncbi:MAG: rRNA adenine dimethylase [Desulfobacterales bacterium]|nr:rRNA adenine dimethylase [Desulfobacterales bacterium]
MEKLINKYATKLLEAGLVDKDRFLIGGIDDDILWEGLLEVKGLEEIFDKLSINSLLFAKPKEPYGSIINFLSKRVLEENADKIEPKDCETRTFLHDLPVLNNYSTSEAIEVLKERKCVIIDGFGVITYGTVSPEQCFVTLSSVCFSTFVKFFSDYLKLKKENRSDKEMEGVFNFVKNYKGSYPDFKNTLSKDIFENEESVYSAVAKAGKLTVEYGLVDSFFGNVSAFYNGNIYISQTGSSLDELDGYIDACPFDGSTCTGLTASSELSAHMKIASDTDCRTILHGHPLFSVIMSMNCDKNDCENEGSCFKICPEKREISGIPIVPGEVGTGSFGLCNTVPPELKNNNGVIVYGHGVFATGEKDFNEPFKRLLEIENRCMEEYFKLVL